MVYLEIKNFIITSSQFIELVASITNEYNFSQLTFLFQLFGMIHLPNGKLFLWHLNSEVLTKQYPNCSKLNAKLVFYFTQTITPHNYENKKSIILGSMSIFTASNLKYILY